MSFCSCGAYCERRHVYSLLKTRHVKTTQAISKWHSNLNQHYVVKTMLLMKTVKTLSVTLVIFETWDVSQTDITRLIACDTENAAACARLDVVVSIQLGCLSTGKYQPTFRRLHVHSKRQWLFTRWQGATFQKRWILVLRLLLQRSCVNVEGIIAVFWQNHVDTVSSPREQNAEFLTVKTDSTSGYRSVIKECGIYGEPVK